MKKTRLLCVAISLLTILSACAEVTPADPSDKGLGRETLSTLESSGTIDGLESESEAESEAVTSAPTEFTWTLEDGKYVYQTPERDDSGLDDLTGLNALYGSNFDDQPDGFDWFFGKTNRDDATDTVTYVWDRSAATLAAIEKYGAIYRGNEDEKVVYLTFDCGYEYGTTSQILDTLKEKNAPATFFLTGQYVKEDAGLITRMLDEGHIIGNHTVGHKKMTSVTVDEFIAQLEGLEDIYYDKFPDAPPMLYFRPPSGTSNEWLLALADKMGYTTVMWSWAYLDYDTANQPAVADALAKAKNGLHNGAVYLLHAESQTNADMLGALIDWIRSEGYEIRPLCDIEA